MTRRIALLVLACAALSCSADDSQPVVVGSQTDPLYYFGQPRPVLTVCVNPTGYSAVLADTAKRALRASWGRAANLSFLGFDVCDPNVNPTAYPLTFQPRVTTKYGQKLGNTDELILVPGVPPPQRVADGTWVLNDDTDPTLALFRTTVIHEFGHVLGFAHEQERPDNWNGDVAIYCNLTDFSANGQPVHAVPGGSVLTPYDAASIMNYCSGLPIKLSAWDIVGARQIYGRNPYAHGFLIQSDRNPALAVRASAAEGAALTLTDQCTVTNPECTWTFQGGMLFSDSDPTLAVNAWGGAAFGTVLRLTRACTASNPDCTWTYQHGELLSNSNTGLAINAWNGAYVGTILRLHSACTAANPDCTFTLPNVMLTSTKDPTLAVWASGSAQPNGGLALNGNCLAQYTDCTWTFTHGLILSDTNAALAITAPRAVPALNGMPLTLTSTCSRSDPACTWTWSYGGLWSNQGTPLPMGPWLNATNGQALVFNLACKQGANYCAFDGQFAKYQAQLVH